MRGKLDLTCRDLSPLIGPNRIIRETRTIHISLVNKSTSLSFKLIKCPKRQGSTSV